MKFTVFLRETRRICINPEEVKKEEAQGRDILQQKFPFNRLHARVLEQR
jgi:hypothetical protein